jgi:aryl-alcohol dehydrogenase-like predicted oxidoreductase
MIVTDRRGQPLSRLMLGTVQFGLPYGVANRTGQPSYEAVREMIRCAVDAGINGFDTASAYGISESILGRVLAELGLADQLLVVTKVSPLTAEEASDRPTAERAIRDSIDRSRQALRSDRLPLVLFHRVEDAVHGDLMEDLKREGRIERWGVSGDHDPTTALRLLGDTRIEALQLPGNLLDRRHANRGVYQAAERAGVAVFVRSVYLQGLLQMPEAEIPAPLRAVIEPRRELTDLAARFGLTLGELAVRYVLSQRGVISVVVGCETIDQLRENITLIDRGALELELIQAVDRIAIDLPDEVITPSSWNRPTAAAND